jgi:colanic acid/amylovoran biosynthesis glycosyltransferase
LKVVVVTGQFPKRSETFVLNHITGVIDLGGDVVIARTKGGSDVMPSELLPYGLNERSFSLEPDQETQHMINRSLSTLRKSLEVSGGFKNRSGAISDILKKTKARMIAEFGGRQLLAHAQDADVIHCHFGHRALLIEEVLQAFGLRIPVVCSFHGIDVSSHIERYGRARYKPIVDRLRYALPVSEFFAERLISMGFMPKDVRVHRVGVDLDRFQFAERRRQEGSPLRLISIGRHVEKKGFEHAIRAVAAVRAERPDIALTYTLVGDGDLTPDLQALVGELGLTDAVHLVGAKDHQEVAQLLAQSHVMIVPSVTGADGDMEGVPTVAMEASATGLPVIATEHSGLPEVVLDGMSGLLSPERDHDAMARNIARLYDMPDLGLEFGRVGRVHIEHEFNIRRQNRKLTALYEAIATGRD